MLSLVNFMSGSNIREFFFFFVFFFSSIRSSNIDCDYFATVILIETCTLSVYFYATGRLAFSNQKVGMAHGIFKFKIQCTVYVYKYYKYNSLRLSSAKVIIKYISRIKNSILILD